MASEAERLAEETGQLDLAAAAKLASATIAAYRGEIEVAERLTAEGESALFISGANPQLAMVQWPRGVAALAAARFDEGYQQLSRIFLPADHAHHPHVRVWVLVDLVEAAVHSEHEDEVSAMVQDLASIAARTRSPLLMGAIHSPVPFWMLTTTTRSWQMPRSRRGHSRAPACSSPMACG